MNRITLLAVVAALFTLLAFPTVSAQASTVAEQCRKLVRLTDLDHAVEPGFMVAANDAAPAHCRVRGVVNRAIRFEVTMPVADWNGRMMFSGVGGSAGTIGDTQSLLAQGFAMASTDTGHEARHGNAFYEQPEALLDYAYRGVHLATQAAKRVVQRFYGRDIDYAYFNGCSNGGRAGLMEAFRFPNDYDGIVAGAPAFRFQELVPWMIAMERAQRANPLTTEALRVLDDASRQACDWIDGVEDGVIDDPRKCTAEVFDISALECADGQTSDCLTAGQIATAQAVYEDIVDAQGNVLSPGVPPGAEAAGDWAFWMLPNDVLPDSDSVIGGVGNMLTLLMRHDPTFDLAEFDPVAHRDRIAAATAPLDVNGTDLSEFHERGGKLLMYQGWNDYPLRPQRAIDFLEDLGGAERNAEFFRLFMVPGMVHCAGGPGPWQADWIAPLVAWREEGVAPEQIIGTQPGPVEMAHLAQEDQPAQTRRFTRPLCPYPQIAKYDGSGDVDDAASFDCVVEASP